MRPSRDDIKQALLHSDRCVRDVALAYLQTVSVPDAEVLPLVIRAIEQYGWEAFGTIDPFISLPQTAETLDWMVRHLLPRIDRGAPSATSSDRLEDDEFADEDGDFEYSSEDAGTYDVQYALRKVVMVCDVQLLAARDEQELAARLPDDDLESMRSRLALVGADGETCWQELQEYAQRQDRDDDLSDEDSAEADVIDVDSTPVAGEGGIRPEDEGGNDAAAEIEDDENDGEFVDEDDDGDLEGDDEFYDDEDYDEEHDEERDYLDFVLPRIEVVAREPDRWRDRVLEALTAEQSDARDEFLLPVMVRLAGAFRLEAATPHIVRLLRSIDYRWNQDLLLRTSCEYALALIGTAEVATELAEAFRRAETAFRRSASRVLRYLRNDRAVQVSNSLLIKEKDWDIRDLLRHALAENLAPEAIEPLRRIIMGQPWRTDVRQRQETVIGICTLLGKPLPEMNKWRKELATRPTLEDEINAAALRMIEALRSDPEIAKPLSGPIDREKSEELLPPERPEPIVNLAPHAGRNDPCPCGSGKKYKKCCWGKTPVPATDESLERDTTTTKAPGNRRRDL